MNCDPTSQLELGDNDILVTCIFTSLAISQATVLEPARRGYATNGALSNIPK